MPCTRPLTIWLIVCALMILAMTGIGAITRLTESGLSITEWNVVSGTLPPLSNADWQNEFDKYQKTPEFVQKHHWMSLEDFQKIYFWEWFHRLWGRCIGLVFALPLIIFWAKGTIQREDRLKFLGLLILGGAQGALGWFMVKSGLTDRPSVSHFRLAAHLGLALTIYAAILVLIIHINRHALNETTPPKTTNYWGYCALGSLVLTIIWGAFTAGLDAGMIYNTFPNMGYGVVPPELGTQPFFTDPASVQFTHRVMAMATGISTCVYAFMLRKIYPRLAMTTAFLVIVQIALGVGTLLSSVWIPVAVIHQINAALLLGAMVISLAYSNFSRARMSL